MNNKQERDQITKNTTKYIVANYKRGRIFSEHPGLLKAQNLCEFYPCLEADDYMIYTPEEWNKNENI
jgi:hypothetical protein